MNDELIVEKILEGNKRFFTVLVQKYYNKLQFLISKIVKNPLIVEELTNDCFMTVFNQLGTYTKTYQFSTWIYTIARNKAIDYYRPNKNKQYIYVDNFDDVFRTFVEENDDDIEYLQNLEEVVNNAINKLDPLSAKIIRLFHYDKLSLQEISDMLNMSVNNVKMRLFRGRKKMNEDSSLLPYRKNRK